MPIDDRLRRIYTVAPPKQGYCKVLVLQHEGFVGQGSYFSENGYLLVTDHFRDFQAMWYGNKVLFRAIPFEALDPKIDDKGQYDLNIVLDNLDPQIRDVMESVVASKNVPITCAYALYVTGESDIPSTSPVAGIDPLPTDGPAMGPVSLVIYTVQVTDSALIATASRPDVVNTSFPKRIYSTREFPGLSHG